MEPFVSVENLVKRYGNVAAVDGVSFDIARGEIFALLGPNGAGKTTTLECLEGLRKADGGRVSVAGINPAKEFSKIRKVLGVQLQASSLPDIITVEEAMKLFCLYLGTATRYDLLEKFDLQNKRKTQFGRLSTGQQRKLALAIALSHNPQLLILDEPTAGLDVQTRVELHQIMRREREEGTAILLASHDMSEVEELADRVAILLNGKVVAAGTPNEIITSGDQQVKIHVKTLKNSILTLKSSAFLKYESKDGYAIFFCEDIEEAVHSVLVHIKKHGDKLLDLKVERPSLEERFVDITKNGGNHESVYESFGV
ncbi:MAG: ABC transporter ATP-binding protein [Bacteroidota bacterium]